MEEGLICLQFKGSLHGLYSLKHAWNIMWVWVCVEKASSLVRVWEAEKGTVKARSRNFLRQDFSNPLPPANFLSPEGKSSPK